MKSTPAKKRSPTMYCPAARRMLLLICLFFWLVPWELRALGEEAAAGEAASVTGSVVTFTNTKNMTPDLYVTKTVQTSPDDTADYSDVEFTFRLWLDGSLARQTEYTVWDKNGDQVFLYEDGESTKEEANAIAYVTSRYGTFTLKAGQTAKFSDVGAGTSYEAEEEETEGFTQILPSGGANAVGTVASDGSVAAFTNLATSGTDPGKSGIRVYKTVSFPNGWTQPENPAFCFIITLNGEELMLEDYEVYDSDTDTWKETRTTGNDGSFTLYAGEYAFFETEANAEYQITENETEGWRTTTDETVSGSSGESVQTVVFNNASASFIVTKTLTEGTAETEEKFTFLLTDGTGTAMAGAAYWLYDVYGNPQQDENGKTITRTTGSDGSFSLKADQAAVFYGMAAGTQYSVSEVPSKGWNQVVPAAVSGYTGKTVSDAVEILPFENEAVRLTGTLTVTKSVEAVTALAAPADDEFTFLLCDGAGAPVNGAVYSVTLGSETSTYKTGENGEFTLHAGETAVFSSLMYGTYSVEETSVPDRAHETYAFSSVTVTDGEESAVWKQDGQSGDLDEDGLAFEYRNTYSAPSSLTIYKYGSNGTVLLAGVTFTLANADGTVLQEKTTGADGKICFAGLDAGTYTVTETSTQDGYTALVNSFTVTLPLTMTKDEAKAAGTDTANALWRSDTKLWYFFDVTYKVTNSAVLDLPETGGNGWFLPVIAGAAILTVLILVFVYRRKLKPVESTGKRPGKSANKRIKRADQRANPGKADMETETWRT